VCTREIVPQSAEGLLKHFKWFLSLSLCNIHNYAFMFCVPNKTFTIYPTTADIDYVTLVQNITFSSVVDSTIISVDIVNDTIPESDETFEVFLKPLPGDDVVIGERSVAVGTIFDDEIPSETSYYLLQSNSTSCT